MQNKKHKDKVTFKRVTDEAQTEESKILGRVYLKNVVNYAVQEFNRFVRPDVDRSQLLLEKTTDTKNKGDIAVKQENKDQETRAANPEAVTMNLRLIKFKMGTMASKE